MKYLEADEYLFITESQLYEYNIGDTISFELDQQFGCGHITDRRSAYYNGVVNIYYVVNDAYSGIILIEEDNIVQREISILLETIKKACFGPADYKIEE